MNDSTARSTTYADLVRLMEKLRLPTVKEEFYLHPDVAAKLHTDASAPIDALALGVPVHVSPYLPKHPKKKIWVFPRDPFIEYEPSDEQWARPVGHGEEVEVDDTSQFIGYRLRPDAIQMRAAPDAFERELPIRFWDRLFGF